MAGVFEGRVALVTGAGRGIGREVALGLAARGARVALVARTESEIVEVSHEIHRSGGSASVIATDIGQPDNARLAIEVTARDLGSVEILINNAAVVAPLGPTQSITAADVQTALAVNVAAVVILSSLVLPGMLKAKWGRIANVSSGIAEHPAAMIGGTVYAASKAALEAHTINLAAELEGTGITVNAYRPGAVDTAMQAWIRDQPPELIGHALQDRFVASHAAGELLTPHESAARMLERLPGLQSGQIWNVQDARPLDGSEP
ncbi:MAG TPA: SDR family NAD(P)-dependent oxidoreductase [Solirubrobacteraceae bacterium]|nr:SDR family NAD(P)-dependent oxidoreductase [Solirubrobacteraceae bacterium]